MNSQIMSKYSDHAMTGKQKKMKARAQLASKSHYVDTKRQVRSLDWPIDSIIALVITHHLFTEWNGAPF